MSLSKNVDYRAEGIGEGARATFAWRARRAPGLQRRRDSAKTPGEPRQRRRRPNERPADLGPWERVAVQNFGQAEIEAGTAYEGLASGMRASGAGGGRRNLRTVARVTREAERGSNA